MAVQSQDIASLFKELEDASKLAKLEEKNNKETTKKQVKELDSFLTSVQKVVKVIEKKDDDTTPSPKKSTSPKPKKKSKPNGKIQEQSKKVETKSLSEDDTKKLDAFSGLIKSFGVEIKPQIVEEDLQLQVEDVKPVIVEQPKIDESKKLEALENLFSGLNALKPEPKIEESLLNTEPEKKPKPLVIETKTPEPVKPVVVSQTPVDVREAMKLVKDKVLPTKQETIEATQQLITDVVDNLDDMKGKTEVKEQIDEIELLRKEFNLLQQQVRQSSTYIGSGSGSGEVRLEFLDDVQRSTAKVDGKFLKYSSSDGKFIGADASPDTLKCNCWNSGCK